MLRKLLSLVGKCGVQSYTTLADQLGVSTGLLTQMLHDLVEMGYIAPMGGACDTSQCRHCPLSGGCAIDTRGDLWVLTAKGTRAAARKNK